MNNQLPNEQPLIVVYNDGSVVAPNAVTYGDLMERFAAVAELAKVFEQKMRATPLPNADNSQTGV